MADNSPDRRRFLSICTSALLAAMGGLVTVPAIAYVTSPLRRRSVAPGVGEDFSDAGAVDAIPAGQWSLVPIEITRQNGWAKSRESRSVWVLRNGTSEQEIKVLSPICTHLGCPVAWTPAPSQFKCPCHGGTFDTDGKHVSGPPPRNMDLLESQVRDGHLWVRWQDFQISVPDRVAVQV